MNSRTGFGLIGLLITVVIIALLSAIMMKAYYGKTTPAQQVKQGIDAIDSARAIQNIATQKNKELQQELQK